MRYRCGPGATGQAPGSVERRASSGRCSGVEVTSRPWGPAVLPGGYADQRGELPGEVRLVEPPVLGGEVGQRPGVPLVEGGDHVVHPVAGEHPLGTDADVAREQPLQAARPEAARCLDLRHPHHRAVGQHRRRPRRAGRRSRRRGRLASPARARSTVSRRLEGQVRAERPGSQPPWAPAAPRTRARCGCAARGRAPRRARRGRRAGTSRRAPNPGRGWSRRNGGSGRRSPRPGRHRPRPGWPRARR